MTPEEVSAGLDRQLGELFALYPRPLGAVFWEAMAKVYRTYTEPALVAWRRDRVALEAMRATYDRLLDDFYSLCEAISKADKDHLKHYAYEGIADDPAFRREYDPWDALKRIKAGIP